MPLTDTTLRSLKGESKPRKLSDAGGLHILVSPNGTRLWRLSYRFNGKQKTISLGAYPDVTLGQARTKRDAAKGLLANGVDPSQERKEVKAEALRGSVGHTWREVATEYRNKREREGIALPTISKLDWLLDKTFPTLGHKSVDNIGVRDLLPVLRAVEAEGQYETAQRLRSVCSRVFRFAIATGRAERDYAADLIGALTAPKVRHQPAILEPRAVGQLMRDVRSVQSPIVQVGLLIAAYCFLRPGEIRFAEWSDVDWRAARLTIPANRMKMPKPHIVPLAPQAVNCLKALYEITGGEGLLFPSFTRRGKPISENTLTKALQGLGYKDRHVPHGFRRTASTILNESGWNRDWIERQLAHVEGNTVRAAYNAAEYLEDRTKMMHWYADNLDRLAGEVVY